MRHDRAHPRPHLRCGHPWYRRARLDGCPARSTNLTRPCSTLECPSSAPQVPLDCPWATQKSTSTTSLECPPMSTGTGGHSSKRKPHKLEVDPWSHGTTAPLAVVLMCGLLDLSRSRRGPTRLAASASPASASRRRVGQRTRAQHGPTVRRWLPRGDGASRPVDSEAEPCLLLGSLRLRAAGAARATAAGPPPLALVRRGRFAGGARPDSVALLAGHGARQARRSRKTAERRAAGLGRRLTRRLDRVGGS
jgi:hypothetical protein